MLCSVAGEQCGNSRQCVACYVSGPGHRITGCSQLSLNNVTTLNTYWTYCHCHTTRLGPVCTPVPGQPWSPQLVKQRKLETGDRQRGRRVRGGSFTWYTPLYYDTPHMICSTTVWHTTLLPWRPGNSLRMWGSVWDQWEHFALSHETKRGKVWMTARNMSVVMDMRFLSPNLFSPSTAQREMQEVQMDLNSTLNYEQTTDFGPNFCL